MKLGDLVEILDDSPSDLIMIFKSPGVIVKGPYKATFTTKSDLNRKPVLTQIMSVVDITVSGKIIESVPTKFLKKLKMNNQQPRITIGNMEGIKEN